MRKIKKHLLDEDNNALCGHPLWLEASLDPKKVTCSVCLNIIKVRPGFRNTQIK